MSNESKAAFFGASVNPAGTFPGNISVRAEGEEIKASGAAEVFFADGFIPRWAAEGERFFLPVSGAARAASGAGTPVAWCVPRGGAGGEIVLICETARGRFNFNFDPAELFAHILLERYRKAKAPLISKLPFDYRAVPSGVRAGISRVATAGFIGASKAGARRAFPRFPVEKSLEALLYAMRLCCEADERQEGEEKLGQKVVSVPGFAVVLSHDVDEGDSFAGAPKLSAVEKGLGLRSVWFVTGKLFGGFEGEISALAEGGNEIGLHEVEHDLKFPYLAAPEMRARLDSVAKFIERYKVRGFRSPYYLRTERMFEALADYFVYDSSLPDCDAFTPGGARGGCGLVRPFKIGKLVEAPVTLPFEIPFLAGLAPEKLLDYWRAKIEFVKAAGGTLVVNTHPDTHVSGRSDMLKAYGELLEYLLSNGGELLLPGEAAGAV